MICSAFFLFSYVAQSISMTNALKTSAKESMETVGSLLREARKVRGVSLADIASVTRIPRNMLEHLERDRFEEYSAAVFVRGHLTNFAREVRLDPQHILSVYDRQCGMSSEPVSVHATAFDSVGKRARAKRTSKSLRRRSPFWRLPEPVQPIHMLTALLVLCALFASVFFLNGSQATAQNPSSFKSTSDDAWSLEKDAEQAKWLLEQPASTFE